MIEHKLEDYIKERSIMDIIRDLIILSSVAFFISLTVLIIVQEYTKNTMILDGKIYFIYILSILSIIVGIFRNKIIKEIIKRLSVKKSYRLVRLGGIEGQLIILLFAIMYFIEFKLGLYAEVYDMSIILFMIIVLWINLFFFDFLKKEGIYLMYFKLYGENKNDYVKRQKWLKKISSEIEEIFKMSGIYVSENVIFYKINHKLLKNEEVELNKLKSWFISERKNDDILSILLDIIPNIELLPLDEEPILERMKDISPEYLKYIVIFFLGLVWIILRPDSVTEILKKIMELV